ncbi:hypothetical protein GGTG_07645 [Gaeumannomyces tritici R3-111a-1]|uniref:Phospholipase/carboxylesterase/thioesterase domain-containing protein n=1 Tax=Gaeumannomyces tritici (strain R3-111a-1) TaxID=644352 RepID=J3P297_GAET3|nr:hypothetical protein GGTG_07645 [Gaeumannomyces tritici R3-111a-1]EJT73789.1 hypothetical protein GGTG_07645 [Gaeumannomyces tritici R3-111a-1]
MAKETERFGGDPWKKLVLGGISQGGAFGTWTLLSQRGVERKLYAFFAASAWLPFAANVKDLLTGQTRGHTGASPGPGSTEPKDAVLAMIPPFDLSVPTGSLEQITIFLGHRADNTYVNVELGRQAAHVLT